MAAHRTWPTTAVPHLPTRRLAAVLVALPVFAVAVVRTLANAPGSLPEPLAALQPSLSVAALAGPALAALVLVYGTDAVVERVGLAFAGAFALVGTVGTPALVAALGVVPTGGAVAVGTRLQQDATLSRRWGHAAVATTLGLGTVASLSAAVGVAPTALRPLGSALCLLAVAALPWVVGARTPALAAGALAAAATVWVGTAAPFVTGAIALVWGAVVGVGLLPLALAVGGGVAATAAAVRRGDGTTALASLTLLAAGVPATVPRATAVVVAVALLVGVGTPVPARTGGGVDG